MSQDLEPPEVIYPQVSRVITDPIFPPKNGEQTVYTWAVGDAHPFIRDAQIFRIYSLPGVGVDIFYLLKDLKNPGVVFTKKHHIPRERVRLTDEDMPPPVFIEELRIAEDAKLGDDDDDDDDDDAPESDKPPSPPVSAIS